MSNQSHSFTGNLTRDPELRSVSSKDGGTTSVVNFSVAVNGRTPADTVYFDCDAWGEKADSIAKWFAKGKPISINDAECRLESWTDKTSGEKRTRLKFRVNRYSFVSGLGKNDEKSEPEDEKPKAAPKPKATRNPEPAPVEEDDSETDEDDEIPF